MRTYKYMGEQEQMKKYFYYLPGRGQSKFLTYKQAKKLAKRRSK